MQMEEPLSHKPLGHKIKIYGQEFTAYDPLVNFLRIHGSQHERFMQLFRMMFTTILSVSMSSFRILCLFTHGIEVQQSCA